MTHPLICMTLTGRTIADDISLVKKYSSKIDLVELRVDYLSEEEQLYVRRFPSLVRHPCILTIRRDVDGGLFTGGEFSRTNLFGRALAFADPDRAKNFAYVDFEDDFHIPSIQDAAMAFGVRIIRSFHSMTEPVYNLRARCDSMRKTGYEIPKIAFMPKSISDVANLFREAAGITEYDHILCAMGPEGFPSRVLAGMTNSYLTYVSPAETASNTRAIGHLDPDSINDIYHIRSIDGSTSLFGITGWPLVKTASPELHNDGYRKFGMNSVYIPVRSPVVSEALSFAEELNMKGLSVTVPHKESVMYYLYDQSQEVVQIGACNTIVRRNDKWIGYNTDAYGFRRALEEFTEGIKLRRKKVAVIGAGGAAKAVAFTLRQLGARVCIFNRTELHARQLAEKYGFDYAPLDPSSVEKLDEYSSLMIQTTPIGMNCDGPSNERNDPVYFYNFRGNEMLFDLIYVPSETPVMRRASQAGCRVCNGMGMLLYQGYMQFKLFTGSDYESVKSE